MRTKKWQDDLNEQATVKEYKDAYYTGASSRAAAIRLSNPHIDWVKVSDEIEREYRKIIENRIDDYKITPPETV